MIRQDGAIMLDGKRLETAWWRHGMGERDRPTLVLLHEGLGCIALWRDFPERIASATACDVFAYSRLGYGHSDRAERPRPMRYMHDEALSVLPRVLRAEGIGRAITLGHSDGGSIAAIHAGGPDGSCLAGVAMMAAHFFVEPINIDSIERIRRDYTDGDLRIRLARYHADVDGAFHGWNDAWLDPRFRRFDITDALQRIRVPVLALQGADDPYGTDAQLHVLAQHVRAPLETRLIEGARHSPHLEAPQPTLSAIAAFVAARMKACAT